MYQDFNLTPREAYRINGQLSPDCLEALIDKTEDLEKVEGTSCQLSEAIGSLPREDFLTDFLTDLYALSKRVRGNNQTELLGLIERAEDLQNELRQSIEYAEDELCKARTTLEEIGL